MAYLVCTDGTVSALLVKLGRSSYNLTIQHIRVLISLALPLSSSFLNPLTDSSMLPSYTGRWGSKDVFFFLAFYFPKNSHFNLSEHSFLHAVVTDAGTVICLNFILQQFSPLIGVKRRGIVRDQGVWICLNININHNVSVCEGKSVLTCETIQPVFIY